MAKEAARYLDELRAMSELRCKKSSVATPDRFATFLDRPPDTAAAHDLPGSQN
jgi:hypothetical protein